MALFLNNNLLTKKLVYYHFSLVFSVFQPQSCNINVSTYMLKFLED